MTDKKEYRGSIHQRQKDLMLTWYDQLDQAANTLSL